MVEDGTVGEEYLHHADDLEDSVYKWNRIGIAKVAEKAMAA